MSLCSVIITERVKLIVHVKRLFAVLLKVKKNGRISDHTYLMLYLLEGNCYRYHLEAHDPRI